MHESTLIQLVTVIALATCSASAVALQSDPGPFATSNYEATQVGSPLFDIRAFGAVGDGMHLDTQAIQAAIDKCSAQGGGTVFVPPGNYLTGTLFLKSNVNMHLASTATILGSTDLTHYATDIEPCGFVTAAHINKCLLYAADAENISLSGSGVIDGQGGSFASVAPDGSAGERPMLMRLARCRRLSLEGLTLQNAAAWCAHFLRCADVRVHRITIMNRAKYNNDGIDLMGTRNVTISDCLLFCEDDAICLQDMFDDAPVRNIVITNCVMSTRWAAVRTGGAHRGGIRDVTVSNCVIHDTWGCGIKLQISGNATMENMTFSNIVMRNVSSPISLRFGNHHYNNEQRDEKFPVGGLKNILFNNIRAIVADEATLRAGIAGYYPPEVAAKPHPGEERQCISICGIPGHPVEGVTLSNIHVTYPGGGTSADAARRELPELEDQYPEYFMFGVLPAYGLYARHARGLTLSNVRFDLASADARPALMCDDVADLDVSGLQAAGGREGEPLIRLYATHDAFIHGSRPLGEIDTFVRIEGEACRDITLSGNDLHRCRIAVQTADGATQSAIASPAPRETN
ncbi:MAG: glycoside hydrolase family 28 protein [Pirellulaceae bacterium]